MSVRATAAAACLGAATGLRSMAGLAVLTAPLESRGAPPGAGLAIRALATKRVRVAVRSAALGEVLADKLIALPARTQPLPLIGRLVLGAVAGSGLARLYGSGTLLPALAAAAAAGAAAVTATRWRAQATGRHVPDAVIALGEDLCVAVLAQLALRDLRRTPEQT